VTKIARTNVAAGAMVAVAITVVALCRTHAAPRGSASAGALEPPEPGVPSSATTTTGSPAPAAAPAPAPPPIAPDGAPDGAPTVHDAPLDDGPAMARLRRVADGDPSLVIERARDDSARFPDSPNAPERASILIHALARQGRASEARGEAEGMVNRYPDSSWVREIEQFTGAHRHRNVRVTASGALESY
jgi:hypothetical protein